LKFFECFQKRCLLFESLTFDGSLQLIFSSISHQLIFIKTVLKKNQQVFYTWSMKVYHYLAHPNHPQHHKTHTRVHIIPYSYKQQTSSINLFIVFKTETETIVIISQLGL